jgi:hypothetical protein
MGNPTGEECVRANDGASYFNRRINLRERNLADAGSQLQKTTLATPPSGSRVKQKEGAEPAKLTVAYQTVPQAPLILRW